MQPDFADPSTTRSSVLVTGANGFIGRALCASLARSGRTVRCAVRSEDRALGLPGRVFAVGEVDSHTDWTAALAGVGVVVHAAARVHMLRERSSDPLAEFNRVNVEGTLNLARQAIAAGVERFVFLSSIKVNGEGTRAGRPYTADSEPAPADAYGISKRDAELGLLNLAHPAGMQTVVIRPVLVYGPGVRANFHALMRCVQRGIPLPLGAVHNLRSLVAVDNLVDLILAAIEHPAAADRILLVSDGEDLSTTELLRRLGQALGKPARLIPLPVASLITCAALMGKGAVAQRLCGSLQVDITQTRQLLGWSPPISVDEGLRRAARAHSAVTGGAETR